METGECLACVELTIPCRPEYVGVARLAILGVASRMTFDYDDVEDVRLAVGETCTTSVDWSERNGCQDTTIKIRCEIHAESLEIEITDEAGQRGEWVADPDDEQDGLGTLLVTLLVDEVTVSALDNGTSVRMVKYARER